MQNLRMMKRKEVQYVTGLSRSSLYAKIKDGSFPAQIALGVRNVAWPEHLVQEWLKNRVLATRNGDTQ